MIGIISKAFAAYAFLKGKVFAMSALTAVTALIALPVYCSAPPPQAQHSPSTHIEERSESPHQALARTDGAEPLTFEASPDDIGALKSMPRVEESFPVTVEYIGEQTTVVTTGATVQEILDQAGVELGLFDTTNLPLDHQVTQQEHIAVHRSQIVRKEVVVELPCETQVIPTSLLAPGKERVLAEGQPGLAAHTYEHTLLDGEETDKQMLGEEILAQPVAKKVLVGAPAHPISEFDFGYELDEWGEPIGHAGVIRSQSAAGYSAREGAKTASGRPAIVGHVAVDPNVIPYGTKLYIKSTDGNFVYGYAVAADTGTAIRDGLIAVDLFYGSYLESALNEIRSVDIFILD